jgi:two-component system sensor histidine kinase DegS
MLRGDYLPAGIVEILHRVTQESLNNIAHHARATQVTLAILEGNRELTLSITDNGSGFDPDQLADGHYGIIGMRERAQAVGGRLVIESSTQRGTTVQLIVPVNREAS